MICALCVFDIVYHSLDDASSSCIVTTTSGPSPGAKITALHKLSTTDGNESEYITMD